MTDHTTLATNESSKENVLGARNKPQVKRSSKLPVNVILHRARIQQPPSNGGGECIRDQQSATQGLSKNCVQLEKSEDKENNEHSTTVESENIGLQHRYRMWIVD